MCELTESHLWNNQSFNSSLSIPSVKLKTRIGSGMATYCKFIPGDNLFIITYGKKMIESKFNPNFTSHWMTHREIKNRVYFNGETSLINVLTHTIFHEFSHAIQQMNNWCYKGSIHNKKFYSVLDGLHNSDIVDTIKNEFIEECNKHSISLEYLDLPVTDLINNKHLFSLDNEISFNHKNKTIYGKVIKVNKKTLIIIENKLLRKIQWKVPKENVTLITNNIDSLVKST